jgi:hypothetical protein
MGLSQGARLRATDYEEAGLKMIVYTVLNAATGYSWLSGVLGQIRRARYGARWLVAFFLACGVGRRDTDGFGDHHSGIRNQRYPGEMSVAFGLDLVFPWRPQGVLGTEASLGIGRADLQIRKNGTGLKRRSHDCARSVGSEKTDTEKQ